MCGTVYYVGTQLNSRAVHCHRTIQLWTARKVNKVKVESKPTKTWQVLEISFLNLSNTEGEVAGRPISFSYVDTILVITITFHYYRIHLRSEHRGYQQAQNLNNNAIFVKEGHFLGDVFSFSFVFLFCFCFFVCFLFFWGGGVFCWQQWFCLHMSIDNHVKYKTNVKIKKYFRTSFFQLNVIPVDGIGAWWLFKQNKICRVKMPGWFKKLLPKYEWFNYKQVLNYHWVG